MRTTAPPLYYDGALDAANFLLVNGITRETVAELAELIECGVNRYREDRDCISVVEVEGTKGPPGPSPSPG